MPYHRAPLSL